MILLGWLAVRFGIVEKDMMDKVGKVCFTYFLSSRVFLELYNSEASFSEGVPMLEYLTVATLVSFVITWILAAKLIKDKNSVGAFVQGTFRSSFTVLGLSMVGNLAGDEGIAYSASVLMMTVILYNTMAVICLTKPNEGTGDKAQGFWSKAGHLIKDILTNPLIIGVILALLTRAMGIKLPYIADKTISYLSDMAIPLSLITIGASLDLDRIKGRIGLAFLAAFIKTFGLAMVAIPVAVFLGFRQLDLAIITIVFTTGNPSASYVMTKSMNGDSELSATALVLSTLLSVFSLTLGLYILRSLGLI